MVKGVNKTVIVVNDTGSKFFEKIVFYVADEFGNLNPKQLNDAATAYKFDLLPTYRKGELRKRLLRRRRRVIAGLVLGGLAALVSLLTVIL